MKQLSLALLLISIIASQVFAEIYQYVDENGRTVYTDTPRKPAEVIDQSWREQSTFHVDKPTRQASPQRYNSRSQRANYDPDEYNIKSSATEKNNRVEISGRISGGEKCNNLHIKAFAEADDGDIVRCTDVTSHTASSSIFRCSDTTRNGESRRKWQVTGVYTDCKNY